MKKFYVCLIAIFFACCFNLKAQLSDGSIGPDFTATDLNGVEHHLYNYLDQGKTVIVDFFTTWCAPCWTYHESGTLDEIWELYGPNGTDEVMIFQIECDPTTTLEDLYGTGSQTQGNWVEGVPYPTIEDVAGSGCLSVIGDAYAISYFPTIYVICPFRLTYEDKLYLPADELLQFVNISCPSVSEQVDAAILQYTGGTAACVDATLENPSVVIQNLGLGGNLTAATIQVLLNNEVINSYAYTGDLALFETETVNMVPIPNLPSQAELTFKIVVEGDTNPENDHVTTTITSLFPTSLNVIVEVLPDMYFEEFTFEMLDEAGNIFFEGAAPASQSVTTYNVTLPADQCITWNILDAYGDGLLMNIGTYVKLLDSATNAELFYLDGAAYEDIHTEVISTKSNVGIAEVKDLSVSIFPNPAKDVLNVTVPSTVTSMDLFNVQGQKVMNIPVSGETDYKISVSQLPAGFYFLNVAEQGASKMIKVVIQ